jgi:hypothetical protein
MQGHLRQQPRPRVLPNFTGEVHHASDARDPGVHARLREELLPQQSYARQSTACEVDHAKSTRGLLLALHDHGAELANWVSDRMFPSGSLNHATLAPAGDVQMPSSSCCSIKP